SAADRNFSVERLSAVYIYFIHPLHSLKNICKKEIIIIFASKGAINQIYRKTVKIITLKSIKFNIFFASQKN
ncbi:MAG TPA: hypothetical protein DCY15_08485, partial [Ruminococcaceae bacterium]|nr:hypothetical protein [Oscillospiraceae bacterium]